MSIKENTIVSTTDMKVTLLQWLKQVQGQLKDLKEKGVKAVVEEFETPEAFYNAYAAKEAGTPVLAIVADDTAIYGTLNEFTDKVNVKGFIYQGDKVYTSAEADTLSIVCAGELASVDYANQLSESLKLSLDYYGDSNGAMYRRWKSETHKVGDFVKIYWRGGIYGYRVVFGQIESISAGAYPKYYILGFGIKDAWSEYAICYSPCYMETFDDEIGVNGTSYIKSSDKRITGIYSNFSREGGGYTPSIVAGGFKEIGNSIGLGFVGCFKAYDSTTFLPKESCAQGIIFDRKNKEVYYPVNDYITCTSESIIENAVSGTELKEVVRLATQKTYWHTIRLHNLNTLADVNITIVIPSHSNNPVRSDQDLLAIGAGYIWGCSGTIATTESALPIVTFDAVKFGATNDATIFSGTLGRTYTLTQLIAKSLEYEDNVKEVK